MTVDYVLVLSKEALMTTIYILAPILGSGLIVGLLVGIFQAITQIHELTLVFVPKIAIVGFVILVLIPWFLDVLLSYTQNLYYQIPMMVQ